MEDPVEAPSKPLPGNLHSLCAPLKHTGDWRQDCSRLMGEYGSIVLNALDKTSDAATLVGIFAAHMQEMWHSHSYEQLVELLTKKPAEVIAHLRYIADHAWVSGPEPEKQNAICAAGYAARHLVADLHNLSLKDRRAILNAAANAARCMSNSRPMPTNRIQLCAGIDGRPEKRISNAPP